MGRLLNLDWDQWVYGLFAAFIGGGSGALSGGLGTIVVDPNDFNIQHPALLLKVMFWTFIFSGLPPFFAYLHQKPLPAVKTVTTVETTEKRKDPPAVIVTTVEETKITK